jgi:hypothetical protein
VALQLDTLPKQPPSKRNASKSKRRPNEKPICGGNRVKIIV